VKTVATSQVQGFRPVLLASVQIQVITSARAMTRSTKICSEARPLAAAAKMPVTPCSQRFVQAVAA